MAWFSKRKEPVPAPVTTREATPTFASSPTRVPEGLVRGKHYTEWVVQIDDLLRAQNYAEALPLLNECIAATVAEAKVMKWSPAPGYTTKAAIAYRKLKRPADEVAVLKAFLAALPVSSTNGPVADRLRKAEDLLRAEQEAALPIACPECGAVLEKIPVTKGTCPSCGVALVVKKVAGQPKLFTPEQASQFVNDDKSERERRKLLLTSSYFGVTEDGWNAKAAELGARFGSQPRNGEVFWGLANDAIIRLSAEENWAAVSRTYFDMEKFVVEEGKDWVYLAKAKVESDKRVAAMYAAPNTEMILLACACPACAPDNLAVRTLSVLLAEWPFPHVDCQKPPCSCQVRERLY
jgi:hypothetical protein